MPSHLESTPRNPTAATLVHYPAAGVRLTRCELDVSIRFGLEVEPSAHFDLQAIRQSLQILAIHYAAPAAERLDEEHEPARSRFQIELSGAALSNASSLGKSLTVVADLLASESFGAPTLAVN